MATKKSKRARRRPAPYTKRQNLKDAHSWLDAHGVPRSVLDNPAVSKLLLADERKRRAGADVVTRFEDILPPVSTKTAGQAVANAFGRLRDGTVSESEAAVMRELNAPSPLQRMKRDVAAAQLHPAMTVPTFEQWLKKKRAWKHVDRVVMQNEVDRRAEEQIAGRLAVALKTQLADHDMVPTPRRLLQAALIYAERQQDRIAIAKLLGVFKKGGG